MEDGLGLCRWSSADKRRGEGSACSDDCACEGADPEAAEVLGAICVVDHQPIFDDSGEDDPEDDSEECGHQDQAVGSRQVFIAKEFGEDTVFTWAEECAVGTHENQDGPSSIITDISVEPEGGYSEEGDDDFGDFAEGNDLAFAVPIGEKTGGATEQYKGQREYGGRPALSVTLDECSDTWDSHQQHELFVKIIVEGSEELRYDNTPEGAILEQVCIIRVIHWRLVCFLECQFLQASQIQFSGAEDWDFVNFEEAF